MGFYVFNKQTLILLRETKYPFPGWWIMTAVGQSAQSLSHLPTYILSQSSYSRDGYVTHFCLEREKEKPAGKVLGNSFCLSLKEQDMWREEFSLPFLFFSQEASLRMQFLELRQHLYNYVVTSMKTKNMLRKEEWGKKQPSFLRKLLSLCTNLGTYVCRCITVAFCNE